MEIAHVTSGDMVTMTLIQGVMNTFVIFLSRVIGYFAWTGCSAQRPRQLSASATHFSVRCLIWCLALWRMVVAWFHGGAIPLTRCCGPDGHYAARCNMRLTSGRSAAWRAGGPVKTAWASVEHGLAIFTIPDRGSHPLSGRR